MEYKVEELQLLAQEMHLPAKLRKYLISYPQWRFALPRARVRCRSLEKIGSEYGGYVVDASRIKDTSIVYSLGIGEDISFDLGLIERFGVCVHAFDPTPRVKNWLRAQNIPERFRYHDLGVSDRDGEVIFYCPPRPDFISHSVVHDPQYSDSSITVPMVRLGTAMQRLGHSRLDVLKMDIEGAEFEVLEDLVNQGIRANQILIEFHHRLSSIGTAKTKRTLALLEGHGMKIAYVCPRLEVFTLLDTTV